MKKNKKKNMKLKSPSGGIKILGFSLFLTACAGITGVQQTNPRDVGGGVLGGIALEKTIQKTREVFTPTFKLIFDPVEICDIVSSDTEVVCVLVPCSQGECSATYDKRNWFKNTPKVIPVAQSLLVPVSKFCTQNQEACLKKRAEYDKNLTIILTEK